MTTHWLLRGLDMRTVVIVTAAGTALYFGLVRSDDAMQRDIADIKDDVAEVKKTAGLDRASAQGGPMSPPIPGRT